MEDSASDGNSGYGTDVTDPYPYDTDGDDSVGPSGITTPPTTGSAGRSAAHCHEGMHDYSVVSDRNLRSMMIAATEEVQTVLDVTSEAAYHLMRMHGWDRDRVYDGFYNASEGTSSLVERTGELPDQMTEVLECRICYATVPADQTLRLGCGHGFCRNCYKEYLESKVRDGPPCVVTPCPEVRCQHIVPYTMFQQLISADLLAKYERYRLHSFVDFNKNMRWCPGVGCSFAVRGDGSVRDVCCDCGTWFCFKCGEEAHSPATCGQLAMWQEKCQNESETANWIIANTKKCPRCHTRIEKNQGCNHMTCSQCKHEFCWICSGPWSDHGAETGGYYKCNRFDAADDTDDQRESARAKRELDRYLHYYQRYHGHKSAQRFAVQQQQSIDQRMAQRQQESTGSENNTWIDVQFLKSAQDQLIECRRVLKYTYVYGYYLEQGPEKDLFEHHQEHLEKFTEELSHLTENTNPARIQRSDVVNHTRVTALYMRNLLKCIDDGTGVEEAEEAEEVAQEAKAM